MYKKICKSLLLEKNIHDNGLFIGYASVFNVIDSHNDIILKGSFINSLSKNEVKLLWQHDSESPIGKILELKEDNFGLQINAKLLLSLQKANEAYLMLKSGIINALSIGYRPIEYDINPETGIRTLTKIELWEVSLVTFPSNSQAKVTNVKNTTSQKKLLQSLIKAEIMLQLLS